MKTNINYFKIDYKNNFEVMDNNYKANLTSAFNLEMAVSNSNSFGNIVNDFFYKILPINPKTTDLFEKNMEILKLLEKNNFFFSEDELEVSIDNILNSVYINQQINFDDKVISDISRILFYSFNKIKKYQNQYKIKTQADFLSNLFEIQFGEIDILKSYIVNSKKELDDNQIKGRKTFLPSSKYFYGDGVRLSNNYKYLKVNEEYNKLPNELIILINKFQYIKKFVFEIEKINEKKIYSYLIILLNVKWLFPNTIEIYFDTSSISLSNILDEFYKRKLIQKLKSKDKYIRTTRFDINQIPYNYNNRWEAFTFVQDKSNDFEVIGYNNNNDLRPSFINSTMSFLDSISNHSNENIINQKNENDYSKIIEEHQVKFDMIIIYSFFIVNWDNILVFNLKMNDSFSKEILKSFYLKKLKPIEIDFLDVFSGVNKFINLNLEFNSLNYQVFSKILGIINFNYKLSILRMSFFTDDFLYSPSGLFKLSLDLEENIEKNFEVKTDNMMIRDFAHHDIDHLMLSQLLKKFEKNLEILISLLLKHKSLRECTLVFHLPELIINEERYINVLIKFIINIFILVAFDKHIFHILKIIAPLIPFDDRKYPILNEILGLITSENCKNNFKLINHLTIQMQLFEMTNIVNLITPNLTSLFLGDLDISTFKAFVQLYTSNEFILKSKLSSLKISLHSSVINFYEVNEIFYAFLSKTPKELTEFFFLSNLKINKEEIESILKIIHFNTVDKYKFGFNFLCEDIINETKPLFENLVCYSKNDSEKLKLLIKEMRKRNEDKEKRKKIFNKIQLFLLGKRNIIFMTKIKPIEDDI